MYCNNTLIARPPGLLPRHLDLLGQALERLSGETRLALARTIAQIAAALVCEAVATALAVPDPRPRHESWRRQESWGRQERGRSMLDPDDHLRWHHENSADDSWEGEDHLYEDGRPQQFDQPATMNWSSALALGLRVSAWWLGRGAAPLPVVSTLALGAATTLAALSTGPVAPVGVSVIEALLGLHELTRTTGPGSLLRNPLDD